MVLAPYRTVRYCYRINVRYSTHSRRFKIILAETPAPDISVRATVNPFNIMMQSQVNYTFLPPLLNHERMDANHCLYNELIGFLEKHNLGWTGAVSSIVGKRFVDIVSKALFQCEPLVWTALNDKHNNGVHSLLEICVY